MQNIPFTIAVTLLLLTAGTTRAQSTPDQSFKSIPQQVKTNAENKATTKSNDVSNAAITRLDSASNQAFRKFTGLFRRKSPVGASPPKTDSTGAHPVDTTILNHKNLAS